MYRATQEEILLLQQSVFEMLVEVDRICRKYKLSYFLDSGTALGAIRHGGFIPWDDDMDVGMLRSDYEKFLELAKTELNPKYVIQTHETEPMYSNFHAKLRYLDTVYPQIYNSDYKYRGFQLDLFPFDKLPNNIAKANRTINWSRWFRKHICDIVGRTELSQKCHYQVVQRIARILFGSWYRSYFERICQKNNMVESPFLTCFSYRMTRKSNFIFKYEDIMPVREIDFCGKSFYIMNNPDEYLRTMYGDYMKLPPEDKRHCHLVGKPIFKH